MRCIILVFTVFVMSCSETEIHLETVAIQHVSKSVSGDACNTLYREDGGMIITPNSFDITPFDALKIATENLGYSCSNKLGAEVFSDGTSYYITRLGLTQDAIIINGKSGLIESKGFMSRKK